MMTRVLLGLGLVSMFAACGGGDDDGGDVTCAEAAAAVGACGGTITEAEFNEAFCDFYIFPDGCAQAVVEADCAEHDLDEPSYTDICFPSCGADSTMCNDDDTITVCSQGSQFRVNCETVCEAQEVPSAYTGTCASEYMDMTSGTGMDVCWCE